MSAAPVRPFSVDIVSTVLRVATVVMVAAAFLSRHSNRAASETRVAALEHPLQAEVAAQALLSGPPPAFLWNSRQPPSGAELDLLATLARRAPLVAALPEQRRSIAATLPPRLRAGEPAALAFRLTGFGDSTVAVVLSGERGEGGTLRVPLGNGYAGAFRLTPAVAGWYRWTVAAGGVRQSLDVWVAPAVPLQVIVAAPAPSWETRFTVAALEEAGANVSLVAPVLPGQTFPVTELRDALDALDGSGAVLLLDGFEPDVATDRRLREFAAAGGGVLRTPVQSGGSREFSAEALQWNLPPELSPLPPEPLATAVQAVRPPGRGELGAAAAPAGDVLVLGLAGQGREARFGLLESWRWRMAGAERAHADFWAGLARWLAAGALPPERFVAPGSARPGSAVTLSLLGGPSSQAVPAGEAASVRLLGADGVAEMLPLADGRAIFVPDTVGVYTLISPQGTDTLRILAVAPAAPPAEAWAKLSLIAARSGGVAIPVDSVPSALDRFTPTRASGSFPNAPPGLWFAAILLLALAEWAVRRVYGAR